MIIYDIPQHIPQDDGTLLTNPEWLELKRGMPSASSASKILTPTGKISAQDEAHLNALLAERAGFGDDPIEQNEWMTRGLEMEGEAREMFSLIHDIEVKEVGWVTNDSGLAGCSPDGLIPTGDTYIGWETKCPKASTHIGYLRSGKLPSTYKPQVHWSMAVTGIKQWYFMSYYPGLDPLILLIDWDEYTDKVATAIDDFTDRLEKESQKYGWRKAA